MQDKPMYKTNFSTVSSLRRGNGQVGSMQNIVCSFLLALTTIICMTTTIVAHLRSGGLYCDNLRRQQWEKKGSTGIL